MPNRIIKDSIRGSDDLASVSSEAERLFWRLVVSVDDFGRFDARPKTIVGQCLTAFLGRITADQVNIWLLELEQAELLKLYMVEDRPYLVLTKWNKHQRTRAKDSKFPSPDDSCGHPLSNDSKRGQARTSAGSPVNEFESEYVNVNESGSGNESETSKPLPPMENESQLDLDVYSREIEQQMVACGASPNYTAKGSSFKWVRKFHNAKVPIAFVRSGIVQAYAKNPEISTFAYCAKIIEELWARELAKQEPVGDVSLTMIQSRGSPQPTSTGRYIPNTMPEAARRAMLEDEERARLNTS